MKFCFILIFILLIACKGQFESSFNGPIRGDSQFWVGDYTKERGTKDYYSLKDFNKKAENSACKIYLATDISNVSQSTIDNLANEFLNTIKPKVSNFYGQESDVDGNGKVTILLFDIVDGATPSSGFIAGLFDPINENSVASVNNYNNIHGTFLRTNEAEVLYVDCKNQDAASIGSKSTIAHEYQHMVGFNQRYIVYNRDADLDTWISEGEAMDMEFDVYGSQSIQARFSYFNTTDYLINSSVINWNSDSPLSNYSLSAAYFNFIRKKINNSSTLKTVFNNFNNSFSGNTSDLGDVLATNSIYTGNGYASFRSSFYDFSITGLINAKAGSFSDGISFSGYTKYTSGTSTFSDYAYTPRAFKYSTAATSINVTGTSTIIKDVSVALNFTDNTSLSTISSFKSNTYGVVLVSHYNVDDKTSDVTLNKVPLTNILRQKSNSDELLNMRRDLILSRPILKD
jgi:hypothetical protein